MTPFDIEDNNDDEALKDDALDGLQGEVDDYSASKIPSIHIEIRLPDGASPAEDNDDEETPDISSLLKP